MGVVCGRVWCVGGCVERLQERGYESEQRQRMGPEGG